ncbi:MAG TPA: hypothetical protein VGG29_17745 [Caulobacteraceae bacterium]|jgi:hypothetical protein
MRRWLGVAAAVVLAGCGQGGGPAGGSGLQAASAAAHAAADKFVAMAQGSAANGQVPRQSDTAAGPLLNAVFDTAALPAQPPPFSQLDPINDWLGSINRVGITYILAGTGVTDISKATADVGPQTLRNVVAFAPEMGRYYDAEMAVTGAEAATISQELAAHPDEMKSGESADGLTKMRGGVAQMMSGVMATLAETNNTPDWKAARAKALAAMAPSAARLLTPDAKAGLRASASQAAADPALKAALNQVATTMGS